MGKKQLRGCFFTWTDNAGQLGSNHSCVGLDGHGDTHACVCGASCTVVHVAAATVEIIVRPAPVAAAGKGGV